MNDTGLLSHHEDHLWVWAPTSAVRSGSPALWEACTAFVPASVAFRRTTRGQVSTPDTSLRSRAKSNKGMAGQEAVNSVNGPLSRDLASLSLFASTIIGAEPWRLDPRAIPIPWRNVELPRKLAFGVIRDDGLVRVNPPVRRALEQTVLALRAQGHEVLELEPHAPAQGMSLLGRCFLADGGTSIGKLIDASGEDWPAGLAAYRSPPHPSTYEMWQIQLERVAWAKGWLDLWMATASRSSTGREIDAILMPTCPFAGALQCVLAIYSFPARSTAHFVMQRCI
jgi:Asp-tRNA(Asn)/Glu-tRNA(Gln) amidotransferase A subunit family amidase